MRNLSISSRAIINGAVRAAVLPPRSRPLSSVPKPVPKEEAAQQPVPKGKPATETKPSPNVDFQCLSDAAAVVRCHIKRHINNENGGKPLAIAISPGAGKSHVLAEECDNAANRIQKIPTLTITPTRSLASEAAQKNGGDDAPARSGVKADAGFCNIYPEIRLFSAAWRSIVLHVCQSCPHGLSAMRRLGMNKDAGDDGAREEPCKYVLNTESSRMSTALSCTGKKANVDESVFKMKSGKGMRQRRKAKNINEISPQTWTSVSKSKSVQALYNIYTTPVRILEKTGESACIADLYGESVSRMYQSAVDGILAAGGDPMNPEAIRGYFDKKVDAGEYSADLEVAEGLLMEWAITIQRTLATGTEGIS